MFAEWSELIVLLGGTAIAFLNRIRALCMLLVEHFQATERAFAVPREDPDNDRLWLIALAPLGSLIFKLVTRT